MKILNQIPIEVYPRINNTSIICVFIGLAVLIIIISYLTLKKFAEDIFMIVGVFLTILVYFLCAVFYFTSEAKPSGKYLYEVTIYDETSFHEIVDKYEIIDKRGNIYTLKER